MQGRIVYLTEVPKASHVELFADAPDALDVPQVAELLGVVPATIRREIARGNLKSFHVGKRVKVSKKQLIAYVEGGVVWATKGYYKSSDEGEVE